MNENSRTRRVRSECSLACFAVIASLLVGTRAMAIVTVKVATDSGARGGALHLTLSATREAGDGSLASLNTDVIFDTAQLDLVGACGTGGAACHTNGDCGAGDLCLFPETVCAKDPRLSDQTVQVFVPDFQNVPPGGALCPAGDACRRIRFAIVATRLPVPTFTDGTLVTCTFQVSSSAPLGLVTLSTDRLQVADNAVPAKAVPAQIVIEAGQITVTAPPTATGSRSPSGTPASPTPTIGSPTATATSATPPATATPTHGTATPTGPSPTPSGIPTPTRTPTIAVERTASTTPSRTIMPSGTPSTPATVTPTKPPTAKPSNTPNGNSSGGGGGGCNCNINAIDQSGVSSFWLVGPAALLFWRRRSRG